MSTTAFAKPAAKPTTVRVAIYTRKSTEEGLDQEFNSLDAQRQSIEAYVASQRGEGWVFLPDRYDDGGFTGANIDRPGFQRLLADIEAKKVDVVAVYKIDRLSRSLIDFVRIMETFQRHQVTFVSITQQFSTTTSMGRLTLNILMSFAEFERQVISERTRDKIAASRRRGMWVGGRAVLGYDVVAKRLVVNESEALLVREIFAQYLELGSLIAVVEELNRRGVLTKSRTTRKGKLVPGKTFDKNAVRRLLSNPLHIGKVPYRGEVCDGIHEPIVDRATWDRVLEKLAERLVPVRGGKSLRRRWGFFLGGLVRCGLCGGAMTHHYTARGARRYSYYVCHLRQSRGKDACLGSRIGAHALEELVIARVLEVGQDDELIRATMGSADENQEVAVEETRGFLAMLAGTWRDLLPDEQTRVVRALVKRVTCHGAVGEIAITFEPGGIAAVARELGRRSA